MLDKCQQQGVPVSEQVKARMLLSSVNERYNYLRKTYQHADVKPSLEKIFAIMRDDDAEFQKTQKSTPIGFAAFLNAVEKHAELLYT